MLILKTSALQMRKDRVSSCTRVANADVLARSTYNNKVMIYSLDRILTLDILADEKFKMPDSFNPTEFFSEYYGVIVDEEQTVENYI